MSDPFRTPWTIAHKAPLSMGFPRQEYWGGLPFPSPGDLPDPGIKPASPIFAGGFFTTEPPGKPHRKFNQTVIQKMYEEKIKQSCVTHSPMNTASSFQPVKNVYFSLYGQDRVVITVWFIEQLPSARVR